MIINRAARGKYQLAAPDLDPDGRVPLTGFHAAREIGHRVNALRNTVDDPDQILKASELYSLTLLDRMYRTLLTSFLKEGTALRLEEHRAALEAQAGPGSAEELADALLEEFPPEDPSRHSRTEGLADLLLLRLANENPASKAVRELIDDGGLQSCRAWKPALKTAETLFSAPPEAEGESLAGMLRRPFLLHPDSLQGQLGYIRDNWGPLLRDDFLPLLGALDFLNEESRPYFGGGPGEQHPYVFSDGDYEGFSADRAWMPLTVMMAKNVLVWLDQLSADSPKPLTRLDEIPDAEFERLSKRGFTALWLIGMWRRSRASKRIKHLCGNSGAEASAYSLTGYEISPELGGEKALEALRIRAGRHGIRLASDMVPNHTGIDADWIYEHPEYYLQTEHSPYPSYSFSGENLSAREGFETYLEDHYFDKSDAAVVFKHVQTASGQVRYIYHGNDGTHMPWNDTAQLNYLNPELRERIIRTIVEVARQFPIVRFDAAMTLAKEHIRRLWFPEPGKGGSVPSRAEHALSEEHFQQLLPKEFWREVVDRTAIEAPDTLLLAEAFWMMEGYFVRTLGMHRVYNSAFMNMLKNEENEKYRQTLQNTLEFDPEILKRFVNFMNNPDEETAVAQFGSGDKYFGICTMLATMPGLPMFGHGQIEGFSEKYGMEYSRAFHQETPDSALIGRHEREIFPLLKRRALFAEAAEFTLFDFHGPDGINHNIFAYTNRREDERALVLYNNSLESASGRIHLSSPYRDKKKTKGLRRRSVGEALSVPDNPRSWLILRQNGSDSEFIRNCREVARSGLTAELPGYGCQVFLDLRIVADDDEGRYRQVAEKLKGAGCAGVEREIRLMHMQPLHAALSSALRPEVIEVFRLAMFRQQKPASGFLPAWERDYHRFLTAAAEQTAATAQ